MMAMRLENEIVYLEGRCPPEESEALLGFLRASPMPAVDLGGCEDFHSAILQVLLAARPVITTLPGNPLLVDCLSGTTVTAVGHEISPKESADSGDRNDLGA